LKRTRTFENAFSYNFNAGFCSRHFNKMRARSARFNSVAVGSKHRYTASSP
jgi:hypothetical protein